MLRAFNACAISGLMLVFGLSLPALSQQQPVPPDRQLQAPGDQPPQFKQEKAPQFSTGALPQLAAPEEPANPVGSGWKTEIDASALPSPTYEGRAREIIHKVNAYFNNIVNLQGRFVQVDPNQKKSKGRFYVRRPGLLRFDYAPPSKMRIVADGRYLSIENHDLKTIDKYPLDSTPFRMVLRPNVNLMRDANIVDYYERDGDVTITIEDKTGESPGSLQLTFALTEEEPGLEIKEWVITDPQGLDTRISLAQLVKGKEVSRDFFASATIGIRTND